jgi:hypothetical protein
MTYLNIERPYRNEGNVCQTVNFSGDRTQTIDTLAKATFPIVAFPLSYIYVIGFDINRSTYVVASTTQVGDLKTQGDAMFGPNEWFVRIVPDIPANFLRTSYLPKMAGKQSNTWVIDPANWTMTVDTFMTTIAYPGWTFPAYYVYHLISDSEIIHLVPSTMTLQDLFRTAQTYFRNQNWSLQLYYGLLANGTTVTIDGNMVTTV